MHQTKMLEPPAELAELIQQNPGIGQYVEKAVALRSQQIIERGVKHWRKGLRERLAALEFIHGRIDADLAGLIVASFAAAGIHEPDAPTPQEFLLRLAAVHQIEEGSTCQTN